MACHFEILLPPPGPPFKENPPGWWVSPLLQGRKHRTTTPAVRCAMCRRLSSGATIADMTEVQFKEDSLIVSPLATFAFKLCFVGDTGLGTGWVRCRAEARGAMVKGSALSPGARLSVRSPESGVCLESEFV